MILLGCIETQMNNEIKGTHFQQFLAMATFLKATKTK